MNGFLAATTDVSAGVGRWSIGPGWLHDFLDLGILGAFLAIPAALFTCLWIRRDVPFRGAVWMFGAFLLACAAGLLVDRVAANDRAAELSQAIRIATACLSWATVAALVRAAPQALTRPDIARLNEQLRREVADREQAERELREREAEARKLALVAGRTDNAVIITDAEGRIEWVNAAFTRITEYRPDEVIGRVPGSFLQGPETDPGVVENMRRRKRLGEPFRAEVLNYAKSGRRYWLSLEVQPIRDGVGRLTHFIAIEADITDRKAAEAALRESEAHKAAVLRMALDAIITLDDRGLIREFNPAAEVAFGLSAGEAIGRPMSGLIAPDLPGEGPEAGLDRARPPAEGPAVGRWVAATGRRRDGSAFPAELAITPIRAGDKDGFTAYIRDITERSQYERSLHRAKEAAEEANVAKSRFLANMSHEIRTPLTAILGYAEVLLSDDLGRDERHEYLRTVLSSGRHLRALIDDILDLAKIENGKLEYDLVPCSPHRIITEVISVLRVAASEKGLHLGLRWEGRVPESVRTDPARFRQLLVNLVGNAVKFTDRGGVRLVARLEPGEAGPMLTVEVHDTGSGISPDDLGRIFDPFEQADGTVTRRNGGTGLGLAISRQIAQGLGGDVTVISQLGIGSIFRASIAAGPAGAIRLLDEPPAEAVERRRRHAEARVDLADAQILVVDDGEENRKLVQLILSRAGARVACADNGEECLAAASRDDYDVILLDMQMPVLDGYRAAAALRDRGFRGPIIALTAHAMRGDDRRCTEAGCSGYLSKPIEIDLLLTTVARALGRLGRDGEGAEDESGARAEAPEGASGPVPPGEPITSTLPVDDPEFFEIVEQFVARLVEKVDQMAEAVALDDHDRLTGLAHWLKGSGGTAGFPALTAPAARLERLASAGETLEIEDAFASLRAVTSRVAAPDPALAR